MSRENFTSTFTLRRDSEIGERESPEKSSSISSSMSGVYHLSKAAKANGIDDAIIEDIGVDGFGDAGLNQEHVTFPDAILKFGDLTGEDSNKIHFVQGDYDDKVDNNFNYMSNLKTGDGKVGGANKQMRGDENNNILIADEEQELLYDSEDSVKITLSKTQSNTSDCSFSGTTFGKKAVKKGDPKRFNPQYLSPSETKCSVEKKHSHSASELEEDNFREDVDTFGHLYMDVDNYKTFFGVGDPSPPVGQWEAARLKHKPSNCSDYNVETLEALKKVTRKFDSFRMRMLRAKSFYQAKGDGKEDGREDRRKEEEVEEEKAILEVLRTHHSNEKCNDFNRVSYTASQLVKRNSEMRASAESVAGVGGEVDDKEVERIRFFYSSIDCEVFAADCLVDVLVSVKNKQGGDSFTNVYRWVQVWVGVPVLILNKGNHPRKPRQLLVALAEKETGLPLWRERISYASEYREIEGGCSHLLNESGSDKRALKMRWSNRESAKTFFEKFKSITSDQNDPLWRARLDEKNKMKCNKSRRKSAKPPMAPFKASDLKSNPKVQEQKVVNTNFRKLSSRLSGSHIENAKKRISFRKQDISVPCDLKEMTRVDAKDRNFRITFAGLLPVQNKMSAVKRASHYNNEENVMRDFRPRLPTN